MSFSAVCEKIKQNSKTTWCVAFLSTVLIGLLTHMPILLSDIPNHDGLESIYFDQNMVTSGRWFLTVACGFSSYYALPWLIGVIGLFFLGLSAAVLVELLEVEKKYACILIGAFLAVFPSMASTFAYVFTLDGYMIALFLSFLSVLFTKKYQWGFIPGALCLAFSLGTYQAYLPFAILLSIVMLLMLALDEKTVKEKIEYGLHYAYMGVLGVVTYYIILKIMLALQGKVLDTYQGINEMTGSRSGDILSTITAMYRDFFAFSIKGKVFAGNVISASCLLLLLIGFVFCSLSLTVNRKMWKKPLAFGMIILTAVAVPLGTNVILLVSPGVTYHLLMRFQWVLLPICVIAFISKRKPTKFVLIGEWVGVIAAAVLVFDYAVTDNVAYSNLQKKYEKTYAYCVRLLDRIERTNGYYQGIPIAMIGVVGDEQYPLTDVTSAVTSDMIGMSGDILLYTGKNYEAFFKNYLGATVNILPVEAMADMYYDERYIAMDSFPGENSLQIIDGVLYIKTENVKR